MIQPRDWRDEAVIAMQDLGCDHEYWEWSDDMMVYPESDDEPGWTVYIHGERLVMSCGCVDFEADVRPDGGIASTAWALLGALLAFDRSLEAT